MGIRSYLAEKLGEFAGSTFRLKSGVHLPSALVRREIDRLNNPLVVPADMLPPSVREGRNADGRALHLRVADRRRVPLNPGEGKICEDCAHFRYDAGQELLRRDSGLLAELVAKLESRAPRREDLGLCTVDDGQALTSRFWGSIAETEPKQVDGEWVDAPARDERGEIKFRHVCPDYRLATEVTTTADARRGRALNPLTWSGGG